MTTVETEPLNHALAYRLTRGLVASQLVNMYMERSLNSTNSMTQF